MPERIANAALNPSRALPHSRGLQEALQRVPPASPVPGERPVGTLLTIGGVGHHGRLILRRKKADKSWEAQAMDARGGQRTA
jgi:hypothetical protein